MQRNWIGKSRGTRVRFAVEGFPDTSIEVFTTRVDTIYGASALILAPEHPLLAKLVAGVRRPGRDRRRTCRDCGAAPTRAADIATAEKEGFFTGRYARQSIQRRKDSHLGGKFRADGIRNGRGDVRSRA